ncbi:hypothetical protein ABEW34_27345 [Paenibacillus algorifonticola]|uniref:hypothetical protein n=1 Tax=Paenibacillus algorifonticola TaxID=684063 RepID=UPI003D2C0FCB
MIYVEQNDLEHSFRKAVKERPKEWSEGFIEYYTNQEFGKIFGYIGLEGTLQVLKARRELEEEIFNNIVVERQEHIPIEVAIIAAFLFYRYKFLSQAKDKNLYRLPEWTRT